LPECADGCEGACDDDALDAGRGNALDALQDLRRALDRRVQELVVVADRAVQEGAGGVDDGVERRGGFQGFVKGAGSCDVRNDGEVEGGGREVPAYAVGFGLRAHNGADGEVGVEELREDMRADEAVGAGEEDAGW